jgi:hypothetical protein
VGVTALLIIIVLVAAVLILAYVGRRHSRSPNDGIWIGTDSDNTGNGGHHRHRGDGHHDGHHHDRGDGHHGSSYGGHDGGFSGGGHH